MNQRQREKIALVVFLLLLFGGICGSIWYMSVGHQWNTAATTIDEATGSLENYTAIIYDGVAVPKAGSETSAAPRTRASVAEEYQGKKADVIQLDSVQPSQYSEGTILRAGGRRIGVFSVFTRAEASQYQNRVSTFAKEEVDFIVCITSDGSLLVGSEGVQGIDIVITTDPLSPSFKSHHGEAYVVESPAAGKIGTILVSPSNVVSSKALSGK
ncbi:hypothetical protein [Curtanaerobium respiraculi]|uniref:hypothetical protein n=1 Tax=Curtanaerobium respiraculi TaxID=2949669 RepID=UPI0024B32DC9|nr:hypothetical protein [Curtanaerobium respiraculi]